VDPPHETFLAARATVGPSLIERDPGAGFLGRVLSREDRWLVGVQQLPTEGELVFTLGVGEEPVATDPNEPLGQGMQEEPADELEGIEVEGAKTAASCVVLITERHDPVLEGQQAVIRDGDAVRVASQVLQHRLRAAERSFGVDDPLGAAGLGDQALERGRLGEPFQGPMEAEPSVVEGPLEQSEELAPEQATQDPDGEEEVGGAGYPAGPIRGQASGGHHAVDVGMVMKVLAPGVEHGEEPDLGPEVTGIGGHLEQGP
jgi:hypothetical protein